MQGTQIAMKAFFSPNTKFSVWAIMTKRQLLVPAKNEHQYEQKSHQNALFAFLIYETESIISFCGKLNQELVTTADR